MEGGTGEKEDLRKQRKTGQEVKTPTLSHSLVLNTSNWTPSTEVHFAARLNCCGPVSSRRCWGSSWKVQTQKMGGEKLKRSQVNGNGTRRGWGRGRYGETLQGSGYYTRCVLMFTVRSTKKKKNSFWNKVETKYCLKMDINPVWWLTLNYLQTKRFLLFHSVVFPHTGRGCSVKYGESLQANCHHKRGFVK